MTFDTISIPLSPPHPSRSMLPPPTGCFSTRDELIAHVHAFAHTQGHAVSIKRSDRDLRVALGCDRGGSYRSRLGATSAACRRETSSRLLNCPFEVHGHKGADGSWMLTIKNSSHNHDVSENMSGHPSCRRLGHEERSQVEHLYSAGVLPRHILSALRQNNPQLTAVARTIYNACVQIRRKQLVGRSPIQALLDVLRDGDFCYDYVCDENGRITHLFAHPLFITLTCMYPTVLLMD